MSKLDEKVGQYINDLKTKVGEEDPDIDLLRKLAQSMGPSIYNADAETVAASSKSEVETVKNNFVMKKLGVSNEEDADEAIDKVMEKYGKSNRNKYRVVIYYLLTKHFSKESLYK